MTNREKYIQFCNSEENIPLFSKSWWLDCVCGVGKWDVALIEKGGHIKASMPYFKIRKKIFDVIVMPKLTQSLGPYLKYPENQKYYKKLSWEKELMNGLVDQLPRHDHFTQNFHQTISNWLPLHWKGFDQTTRYTYVIAAETPPESIEERYENDIRRRRRKGKEAGVEVVESDDIGLFYDLNMKTFERQQIAIPYDFKFIKNLYEKCKRQDAVKILLAIYNGKPIAGIFLVQDSTSVFYLMGGMESAKGHLGGMDMLHHEGIKYALENGKNYDFEGSMIESLEKYARSFGAQQTPYFKVSKTNSKLLKIKNFIFAG